MEYPGIFNYNVLFLNEQANVKDVCTTRTVMGTIFLFNEKTFYVARTSLACRLWAAVSRELVKDPNDTALCFNYLTETKAKG